MSELVQPTGTRAMHCVDMHRPTISSLPHRCSVAIVLETPHKPIGESVLRHTWAMLCWPPRVGRVLIFQLYARCLGLTNEQMCTSDT
jgi:hypothetical protein